eukprot:scaffold842_cov227-Pinguiococcus_pyrenoidosus.AAC.12
MKLSSVAKLSSPVSCQARPQNHLLCPAKSQSVGAARRPSPSVLENVELTWAARMEVATSSGGRGTPLSGDLPNT